MVIGVLLFIYQSYLYAANGGDRRVLSEKLVRDRRPQQMPIALNPAGTKLNQPDMKQLARR